MSKSIKLKLFFSFLIQSNRNKPTAGNPATKTATQRKGATNQGERPENPRERSANSRKR